MLFHYIDEVQNRNSNSQALLHVSSTTLTMGHNTSRVTCPEKSNNEGDPGKLTEGIQSGEKIMDKYDSQSSRRRAVTASRWKNKDQRRVTDVIM